MRVLLREEDRARLRAHAEAGYPDEVCGFLLGSMDLPSREFTVRETRAAVNRRGSGARRRYRIDPDEYRTAEGEAERRGLELIGIYHSHPDAPARPSEYDREHAWPNSAYVIVSVEAGRAGGLRAWLLAEDRSGFDELDTFEEKGG
ncbi:MAG TPA: M67 family metallopeptidase [Gemmatimonadota bacterium]|nr:M67 family metallopeptidase [Gemmatimonadota bacterium]